jgi:hypothetical protein
VQQVGIKYYIHIFIITWTLKHKIILWKQIITSIILRLVFCEDAAITETCQLLRFTHMIVVNSDSRAKHKYNMQDRECVLIWNQVLYPTTDIIKLSIHGMCCRWRFGALRGDRGPCSLLWSIVTWCDSNSGTCGTVPVLKFCCVSLYMCKNIKFCLCVEAYTVIHRLLIIKRSAAEWSYALLFNTVLAVHNNTAKCKCVVVKLTVCSEGYLPQGKHILHNKHSTLQSFVTQRIKNVCMLDWLSCRV